MAYPFSCRARNSLALCGTVIASICIWLLPLFRPLKNVSAAAAPPQPVLVELFTSEGCSSCPPADALLARLDAAQFVPGARAIVLSEHVTYWNYLGWSDPFSFEAMSDRQQKYGSHFGLDSVYTPQAVVDGEAQVLGSDPNALALAVSRAAARSKMVLKFASVQRNGNTVTLSVRADGSVKGMLTVALAENVTVSSVRKGENAGRTLHHVAVVRTLKEMGSEALDGRTLTLNLPTPSSSPGQDSGLRVVAFVTNNRTGAVQAITEQTIP
jgi:hypothetical protein